MNKLIIFNESVKSFRKSQQTIHSRIGMIWLHKQRFSQIERVVTKSDKPKKKKNIYKEGMSQKYKELFCFSAALVNKNLMCLQKPKKKLVRCVCVL